MTGKIDDVSPPPKGRSTGRPTDSQAFQPSSQIGMSPFKFEIAARRWEFVLMSIKTGFIWHEAYAWYQLGNEAGLARPDGRGVQPDRHAYDPETVRRFRNLVEMSGLADHLVCMKPTPAAESDLLRVHTREHVEQIRALSAHITGGEAELFMPVPAGGFENWRDGFGWQSWRAESDHTLSPAEEAAYRVKHDLKPMNYGPIHAMNVPIFASV